MPLPLLGRPAFPTCSAIAMSDAFPLATAAGDADIPPYAARLNPPQREAVLTTEGPVLMLAGAGTGKTSALTARLAHLVAMRLAWPSEILCVTFTNKAAREMQQRARKLMPKPRPRDDGQPSKPTICTFHSLCVRILRRHIDKLGYKRNFVIYSESEQLGVRGRGHGAAVCLR